MADGRYMLHIPPHPGIVSVNWQGRVGSLWAVETEFINGAPLSHLMDDAIRWSKITFEDIIRWFAGVAEALTSAPIIRPRQFNQALPPALDELIVQLLVDEPARHLSSASELQQRLQTLLSQERPYQLPTPQPLPPGTGYLDRAVALLAQRKLEEARDAAAEATLHSTGLMPALELYGKLSDQLGYTHDAISAFRRLLALEDTSEETRRAAETHLADLYLRLHRYEDAEEHIERILQSRSVPKAVMLKAAIILGACTKLDRALELLQALELEHQQDGAVLEKKPGFSGCCIGMRTQLM